MNFSDFRIASAILLRDRASSQQMIGIDSQGFHYPHEEFDVLLAAVEIFPFRILHDVQCGHRTGYALHGHVYPVALQHVCDHIRQHRCERDDEHHRVLPRRPVDVHPGYLHPVLGQPEGVLHPVLIQISPQHRIRGSSEPYVLRIRVQPGEVRDQHPYPTVLGEGLSPLPVERQLDADLQDHEEIQGCETSGRDVLREHHEGSDISLEICGRSQGAVPWGRLLGAYPSERPRVHGSPRRIAGPS